MSGSRSQEISFVMKLTELIRVTKRRTRGYAVKVLTAVKVRAALKCHRASSAHHRY
jgi:hypothetical protein